jgi:hypothetical protein
MQSTTRLSLVVLAAAILLGAGVILADLYGPEPAPAFYNRSGIPVEILAVAGTSTVTRIDPASFEQYCLPPGVGPEKFLTTFWGMVVNKTHGDDSSAVLLDFSFIGHPGRLPQMMHFSFSSKKDWWSGSHMVIFSGNETSSCGCASVTPWRESPDISAKVVPRPGPAKAGSCCQTARLSSLTRSRSAPELLPCTHGASRSLNARESRDTRLAGRHPAPQSRSFPVRG